MTGRVWRGLAAAAGLLALAGCPADDDDAPALDGGASPAMVR